MSKNAEILCFENSRMDDSDERDLVLTSGYRIDVHNDNKEEVIKITSPNDDLLMQIRITNEGPVVCLQGAHLQLHSTETIALEAKKINIQAQEETVVESKGKLDVKAAQKMDIHADDDIKISGKMVHIN